MLLFVGATTFDPADGPHSNEWPVVESGTMCSAFSRDGHLFGALRQVGTKQREVEVWSVAERQLKARLVLPLSVEGNVEGVPCLAFGDKRDQGREIPLVLLVTYRNPADFGGTTATAWKIPAFSSEAVVQTAHAAAAAQSLAGKGKRSIDQSVVRSWSGVVGTGFDPTGTRLLLTRTVAGDPDRSELVSIAPADWRENIVNIPNGKAGAISGDGLRFATASGFGHDPYVPLMRGYATEVRDTSDGNVRVELPVGGRFTADSDRFIATNSKLIRRWDLVSGQESMRLVSTEPVAAVLDSPGGRYLAVTGEGNSVELWDTGHPQEVARIAGVTAAQPVRGGDLASTTGPAGGRLLDLAAGQTVAQLQPGGSALEVTVSPDGSRAVGPFLPAARFVIIAGPAPTQRLVDLSNGGRSLWQTNSAVGASFSPDGTLLLVAHQDGTVAALAAGSGKSIWRSQFAKSAVQTRFSPDGRLALVAPRPDLAGSVEEEVIVVKPATGEILQRLSGQATTAFGMDQAGRRLALGRRGQIGILEVADGRTLADLTPPTTLDHIGAVAFLPDGQRLATLAGNRASTFFGGGFYTELAGLVWELASGTVVARIPPGRDYAQDYPETLAEEEKAYLADGVLSADGRTMAATVFASRKVYWTVSADRARRSAVAWDLTSLVPREILRLPDADVLTVSDGSEVMLVRSGNAVLAWALDSRQISGAACLRLSRNLNAVEWRAYFGDRPYKATCPGVATEQ